MWFQHRQNDQLGCLFAPCVKQQVVRRTCSLWHMIHTSLHPGHKHACCTQLIAQWGDCDKRQSVSFKLLLSLHMGVLTDTVRWRTPEQSPWWKHTNQTWMNLGPVRYPGTCTPVIWELSGHSQSSIFTVDTHLCQTQHTIHTIHTHKNSSIWAHSDTHAQMYIHAQARAQTHTHTYTHMHKHTHTHIHTRAHAHTHTHTHTLTHTHTYTHTQVHTHTNQKLKQTMTVYNCSKPTNPWPISTQQRQSENQEKPPTLRTAWPMGMGGTHWDTASRKVWMELGWQSFCPVWLPLHRKGAMFWPRACWFFSDTIFQILGNRSSQEVWARSVLMWHSWVREVRYCTVCWTEKAVTVCVS